MRELIHAPVASAWETATTHVRTPSKDKLHFWREFVMDVCLALFSPILTFCEAIRWFLGRIQELVREGSGKRPPTFSNCYCYLTSPFFTRKSTVKIIFSFYFRGCSRTTLGRAPGLHADGAIFLQLISKRETKLSVISSEIMTQSRFHEKL